MKSDKPCYCGYQFPPEIISRAVWLYYRFCLSFRDVEDLIAERGITVSYETIRQWCRKFGTEYAQKLKQREGQLGDTWFLDELFVTIQGKRHYLWRAVDQDGDVIDILVQPSRDRRAAERFFQKLLKGQGTEPLRLVTDKLRSYGAAHRTVMRSVRHDTRQYANNRGRSLTSRLGSESVRCEGTNRQARPSASCPFTESSRTCSGLGGTSQAQTTTGRYEILPSASGGR